jgi:hypothetical protein
MLDLIFSGRNVFILFLVLAGGFLQPLFPCNTTKLFTESKLLRHILGFFTLIFFVVVADTELDGYMPLGTLLTVSAVIYLWFLIASKMTANWWLVLVALLGGLYLIDLYEDRQKKEDPIIADRLTTTKTVLIGASLLITLVGFLIYLGEKKLDYKGKFNYSDFFLGTPSCKETPTSLPYMTSLQAAFMEPPGRSMVGGGGPPMSDTQFLGALSTGASPLGARSSTLD